jgi:hypothetical protein
MDIYIYIKITYGRIFVLPKPQFLRECTQCYMYIVLLKLNQMEHKCSAFIVPTYTDTVVS